MIPLQLTIEGLYSYQKRQVINFEELTEGGLFGIFGAVGSGKSTILEAITFALYGQTERLNTKDKRAYNMMNLKSDRVFIEFDFLNYENKTFRITRDFKRNHKNFNKVESPVIGFYQWENENWVPISYEEEFNEVIGHLSYNNFKRTIIIPQGQFKEFLELGATDRTHMMKEIFNLQKFDLFEKTSQLAKENQSLLDNCTGQLIGYEEVSQEKINELKEQLKIQTEEVNTQQKLFEVQEKNIQKLAIFKDNYDKLLQKKEEFSRKEEQKSAFEKRREQFTCYEKMERNFAHLFKDKNKNESDYTHELKEQKAREEKHAKVTQDMNAVQSQIDKIKSYYDALNVKRKEEDDLRKIIDILSDVQIINNTTQREEKGKEYLSSTRQEIEQLKNSIKQSEEQIQSWKAEKIDSQTLMEVSAWYHQKESHEKLKVQTVTKLKKLEEEFKALSLNIPTFLEGEADFEKTFLEKKVSIQNERKQLESQKSQLQVQQQLSHYSHNLHDGEPCPLCGSKEHPNIAEVEDVQEQIEKIQQLIEENEVGFEALQTKFNDYQQFLNQKKEKESQIQEEKRALEELQIEEIAHENKFVWKEFNPYQIEVFNRKKEQSIQLGKQIEAEEKTLLDYRVQLEKKEKKEKKFAEELEKIERQQIEFRTRITQNKAQLSVLKYEDYEAESQDELNLKLTTLQHKNKEIDEQHTQWNSQLQKLMNDIAYLEGEINNSNVKLQRLSKEKGIIQLQIQEQLNVHQVATEKEVQEVLALSLDIEKERATLDDFFMSYQSLKKDIHSLEEHLKSEDFNLEMFQIEKKNSVPLS